MFRSSIALFALGCAGAFSSAGLSAASASAAPVLAAGPSAAPAAPSPQAALLEEAEALLREGQTRAALARFETFVERYPKDPRGYSGAATALIGLRRVQQAAQLLRTAHEIAPGDVPVLFNLAACLHNQALYDQAIVYWRELRDRADVQPELARRPDWIRSWGVAASELDRSPEALEAFQRLVRLEPDNALYRGHLANELLQAARFEEAVSELECVVKARGSEPRFRYQLGWAYLRVGRDEDAERELLATIELDPNLVDAHLKLGTLYSRLQRFGDAIVSYRAALRANALSAEALHALARILAQTGDKDGADEARRRYEEVSAIVDERTEALRECLRRVAAEPRDVKAYAAVARFYLEQNDADSAEPWLQRLLALDPVHEEALLNLSTILARRGNLEASLLEVEKLLERDTTNPRANLCAGRILCTMRRWKDAIPYLEASLPGLGDERPQAELLIDAARKQAGRAR